MPVMSTVLAIALAATQAPPSPSRAGDTGAKGLVKETKHLKLTASANPRASGPRGRVLLFIDVEPRPKMHVYAPDQEEYIPITLTLTPDSAFTAQPVKYPPAETYFFAPLKETQRVYSKPFRLEQPVTLAATAAEAVTLRGTVRYQACDDAICYVPQNVPVEWTIAIRR